MISSKRNKGLMKKATAAALGLTLALTSLMLPPKIINGSLTSAYAETSEAGDCEFQFEIEENNGAASVIIIGINSHGDTVEIPSVITHMEKEYPVTAIGDDFLRDDQTVKTVIFPGSVKIIGERCMYKSSVKDIVLPDGVEEIKIGFACSCPDLSTVKYSGTGIRDLGTSIFNNSQLSGITNDKGAVCLGNWLIKYTPDDDLTSIRISDLGSDGIKIENLAYGAIVSLPNIDTLDLKGIKYLADWNFSECPNLSTVINDNSIVSIGTGVLKKSPWYENAASAGFIRLGSLLIYYRTDSDMLDLTSSRFDGIRTVMNRSLPDCKNIKTVKCSTDCIFKGGCFLQPTDDPDGDKPAAHEDTPDIEHIYVDGKELTYSLLMEDTDIYTWLRENFSAFEGSPLITTMIEVKTKELFRQLDIPYYDPHSDERPDYTPTEQFYIRLKIHNYISLYDYDHEFLYPSMFSAFLLNGKCYCATYAELTQYLLQCAGMESQILSSSEHAWNNTKIGDEWFESDDGWDAQNNNHGFGWFGLSSSMMYERDNLYHYCRSAKDSFDSLYSNATYAAGERTIGDTNGDNERNKDDAALLWSYIKGETDTISEKGADVNFDGTIDVTDAVLLENFVSCKALDLSEIPEDGFAPSVKAAFIDGEDYDNIQYVWTDREGYIRLPAVCFNAPEGKKLSYDIGRIKQTVRITDPLTVVHAQWIDSSTPDYDPLGDVNSDGVTDIEDAVAVIQYINGMTPLRKDEEKRADVTKDKTVDIDDAVTIISYINGNITF